MRKIVTGLMGLTMMAALAGSASADVWHHHHRHVYYAPAPVVRAYVAPRAVYYPAPAPVVAAPYCAGPAVVPAVPLGAGVNFSTRRFSVGVGF